MVPSLCVKPLHEWDIFCDSTDEENDAIHTCAQNCSLGFIQKGVWHTSFTTEYMQNNSVMQSFYKSRRNVLCVCTDEESS